MTIERPTTEQRMVVAGPLWDLHTESGVEVVHAVELGSRAWGFASPTSDWDVRFVFRRSPLQYVSLEPKPDTLRRTVEAGGLVIDLEGWDVRKVLRLAARSNPQLFEWLRSPITYVHGALYVQIMTEVVTRFFSPRHLAFHYLHMGRGNRKEFLAARQAPAPADAPPVATAPRVPLKKYLYVMRAYLACWWIVRTGGAELPPIDIDQLATQDNLAALAEEHAGGLAEFHERVLGPKLAGATLDDGEPLVRLDALLDAIETRAEATIKDLVPNREPPSAAELDPLLWKLLGQNGSTPRKA